MIILTSNFNDNCKNAFTLAEVLITLGIIGVVAALTIPTLINNYNKKVTVAKVKKMYSTLSNAYKLYRVENGPAEYMYYPKKEDAIEAYNVFAPYLKVVKDCGTQNVGGCINKTYKTLDKSSVASYGESEYYYKVILNDSSALIFRGGIYGKYKLEVFYDTNGPDKPNQWGVDLFEFDLHYDDTMKPCGFAKYETECSMEKSGYACAAWIIYKGNMDYPKN